MKLPRHAEIWLLGYLSDRAKRMLSMDAPVRRVWVALTDHFEPLWNRVDDATGLERVKLWPKCFGDCGQDH